MAGNLSASVALLRLLLPKPISFSAMIIFLRPLNFIYGGGGGNRIFIMFFKEFFRFTYNRLFLLIFLLFVSYLYRSFPLIFSLFVSSFPVIACTAILLGLLLSFGNPNFPENESDCYLASETLPLLSGVPESVTNFIDTKDRSFTSNKFVSNRKNFSRKSSEVVRIEGRCIDFSGNVPLISKKSGDFDVKDEDRDVREDDVGFNDDYSTRNQYIQLTEDTDDLDLKLEACLSRASLHTHSDDQVNSHPGSLHSVDPQDEDSASSNASIGNVIPILDELHPLLDLNTPQPRADLNEKGFTNGDSDALDHSQNEEKEEGEEDDEEEDSNEGEEEEEDAHDDKENDMKPRIPWTEDDQKNVMDLGTSELERNQRLENLIARRRLRKQNIKLMAERNLIDLDSTDINFPVASISTGKLNPFDLPYDSAEDTEFGVMPGSAPSVLLPRRNPFDIPYDSNEEKPDLKGDSFHHDSTCFHPKDTFFRRYESFTTRPSSYTGPPLYEKGEFRTKSVLSGENMTSQGGNHSSCEKISTHDRDPKLPLVEEVESSGSDTDIEDESGGIQGFTEEAEMVTGELLDVEHIIQTSEADYECEEVTDHGYLAYSEPDTPEFIVESAASSPRGVCKLSDEEKTSFVGPCREDSPPLLDSSIPNHTEMGGDGGNIIQEPVYDSSPTANVNRNRISSETISESQPGPNTDAFIDHDNDEDVISVKGSTFETPAVSLHSTQRETSEKISDADVENVADNDGASLNEEYKVDPNYTGIPCEYATEPDDTPPCLDRELPVYELNENCVTKAQMINSLESGFEVDILDDRKQVFSSAQSPQEPENEYSANDSVIIDEPFDSTVPQDEPGWNPVVDVEQDLVVGPTSSEFIYADVSGSSTGPDCLSSSEPEPGPLHPPKMVEPPVEPLVEDHMGSDSLG